MSGWIDWSSTSPELSFASILKCRESRMHARDPSWYRRQLSSKRMRSLDLSTSLEIRNAFDGAVSCMSLESQESRYLLCGGLYGAISLTDLESFEANCRNGEAKIAKSLWVGRGFSSLSTNNEGITSNRGASVGGLMITSLEWYPQDSGIFVSALASGSLSIWDAKELSVAYTFQLGASILSSKIRGYESGALIAVGLGDSKVKLCDTRTGDSCLALQGHTSAVSAVDWCPSSPHQLASASLDGTVKVWDVRRGGDNPPIMSFDWLQDHTAVARYGAEFTTVDGTRSRNPSVHHTTKTAGSRVKQGMSNTSAHTFGHVADGLHQWTVDRQKEKIAKAHVGGVFCLKYTPCGRYIVSCGADQRIRLWEAASGKLKPVNYDVNVPGNSHTRLPYDIDIAAFTCAGDDLLLLPHGVEGDIAVVPLHSSTGTPISILKGHLGMPTSLLYRRAYHQVISTGKDGMIFLWDSNSDKPQKDRKYRNEMSSDSSYRGAANLELSIDVDSLRDGHRVDGPIDTDYWSDEDTFPMEAASRGGHYAEGQSTGGSATRRFLPPIIRQYLEDARQRRSTLVGDTMVSNPPLSSNGVTGGSNASYGSKRLKKVDLRAKYGKGARFRKGGRPI